MKNGITKLVGLFIVLSGLANTAIATIATYQDPKGRFSLDYLNSDWVVDPPKASRTNEGLVHKTALRIVRKWADEKYKASFSIVIDDLDALKITGSADERLGKYRKYAFDFLREQKFQVTKELKDSCPLAPSSFPCAQLEASHRDFGLSMEQVIWIDGKSAYLMTASARIARFPKYRAEFDQMFRTLKLATPQNATRLLEPKIIKSR